MTTVTISLPDSLKKFVDKELSRKGYGNVSEYFRSLLREAKEQNENKRIETMLLKGLASGKPKKLNQKFWQDLQEEAIDLLKKS